MADRSAMIVTANDTTQNENDRATHEMRPSSRLHSSRTAFTISPTRSLNSGIPSYPYPGFYRMAKNRACGAADLTSWFRVERVRDAPVGPEGAAELPFAERHAGILVGVDHHMDALSGWLEAFLERRPGTPKGAFLLGPPGTGKSRVARAALLAAGLRPVERGAASLRTRRGIEDDVSETIRVGLPNALIFEDVDTIPPGLGGPEYVCSLINPLRGTRSAITHSDRDRAAATFGIPIVCVANSRGTRPLNDLANDSLLLRFEPLAPADLALLAGRVLAAEGRALPPDTIARIAAGCNGDARQFVNSLEYAFTTGGGVSARMDEGLAPADVVAGLFGRAPPAGEACLSASSDPVSVAHLVQENYVLRDGLSVAAADAVASALSDAEIFMNDDPWRPAAAYVGAISATAAATLCGGTAGEIVPGTSWSKHSYRCTRSKQLARARDLLRPHAMRGPEHVAGVASAIRALAERGAYGELASLARGYGLDHNDVNAVVRATSAEPLRQRHKTALKRLLPPRD